MGFNCIELDLTVNGHNEKCICENGKSNRIIHSLNVKSRARNFNRKTKSLNEITKVTKKMSYQWNTLTDKAALTLLMHSLHINLIPYEMVRAYIDRKCFIHFMRDSFSRFFHLPSPIAHFDGGKNCAQFLPFDVIYWYIQGKHHVYLLN